MEGTSYRVIKSGHTIEVYEYEHDYYRVEKLEKEAEKKVEVEKLEITNKEENRRKNDNRARQEVRRLINANWEGGRAEYFITLTYADNMQDVEMAQKHFRSFIKAIRRKYGTDIKHLAVMEWQKRGAIHFHLIVKGFDLGDDPGEDMEKHETEWGEKIWKYGFVDIMSLWAIDNIGAYLTKELLKDIQKQQREEGKRRYYHSQNLDKPMVITGEDATYWIDTLKTTYPHFTNSYEGEFTGQVIYREYNLERIKVNL